MGAIGSGMSIFCFFIPLENYLLIRSRHQFPVKGITHGHWPCSDDSLYATNTVARDIRLYGHLRGPHKNLTCCRTVGRRAVTTCFSDFGCLDQESKSNFLQTWRTLYRHSNCSGFGVFECVVSFFLTLCVINVYTIVDQKTWITF